MNVTLTTILAIAAVLLIFKIFSKFTSKILGFILIVGGTLAFMYYKSWGPFQNNVADIAHLESKYCDDSGDKDICDCIIKRARKDMAERFTREEINALKEEKIKAAYILQKSLSATKVEAIACLTMKGEEGKYKTFMQDFVPIKNEYLNLIGEKARDAGNKVKEEVEKFNENKKGIDDKY